MVKNYTALHALAQALDAIRMHRKFMIERDKLILTSCRVNVQTIASIFWT